MYELAVDLGTAYTAAAIRRDDHIETLPLGLRTHIVPTVVFVADDRLIAAEQAAALGAANPSRLVREFKRRVGTDEPLVVGGRAVTVHELMAAMLSYVRLRANELNGAPPSTCVLTCPVEWGEFRRQQLVSAAESANLAMPVLCTEPEAAAAYYSTTDRVEPGSIVGVYDFGGGTFDATLLRKSEKGFELIGVPAGDEQLGGVDLDRLLYDHVTRPIAGHLQTLDRRDASVAQGLAKLRDDVVTAKELLCQELSTSLSVVLPGLVTQLRVTRREFEDLARPAIERSLDVFEQCLQQSGYGAGDLSRVLLVGGTSRIPLVAELVVSRFGVQVAIDAHPKYAVSLGALQLMKATTERSIRPVPPPPPPPPLGAVGQPGDRQPAPRSSTSTRRVLMIVAALVAAVVAIGAGYFALRSDRPALSLPRSAVALSSDEIVVSRWTKPDGRPGEGPSPGTQILFILNARTGGERRLTRDDLSTSYSPVLTHDRRTVLYYRKAEGAMELRAISADGARDILIRTGDIAEDGRTAVSQDDRFLVYPAKRASNIDLKRLDLRTGNEDWLTDDSGVETDPNWSPSGAEVVYSSVRAPGSVSILSVVDVRSKVQRGITTEAGHFGDVDPAFSPDGSQLAFSRNLGDRWVLHLVSSSGGSVRELLAAQKGVSDWNPAWSPDGTLVAFESLGRDPEGVYLLEMSTKTARALRTGAKVTPPTWIWDHHPSW